MTVSHLQIAWATFAQTCVAMLAARDLRRDRIFLSDWGVPKNWEIALQICKPRM
jgi:hypothetical protein